MYTEQEIEIWKSKAEKWDALDAKIMGYYYNDNGEEIADINDDGAHLIDIGEAAAIAFGFM